MSEDSEDSEEDSFYFDSVQYLGMPSSFLFRGALSV